MMNVVWGKRAARRWRWRWVAVVSRREGRCGAGMARRAVRQVWARPTKSRRNVTATWDVSWEGGEGGGAEDADVQRRKCRDDRPESTAWTRAPAPVTSPETYRGGGSNEST